MHHGKENHVEEKHAEYVHAEDNNTPDEAIEAQQVLQEKHSKPFTPNWNIIGEEHRALRDHIMLEEKHTNRRRRGRCSHSRGAQGCLWGATYIHRDEDDGSGTRERVELGQNGSDDDYELLERLNDLLASLTLPSACSTGAVKRCVQQVAKQATMCGRHPRT